MDSKKEDFLDWQPPKTMEAFIHRLPERYEAGLLDYTESDREWKAYQKDVNRQRFFRKKPVLACTVLAASLLLFIGTAFASPAVAQVAAKIPILNLLFETEKKPLMEELQKALDEKGYKWDNLGMGMDPREISVGISGSNDYYHSVKQDVKELVEDIMAKRNDNAFKVKIFHSAKPKKPTAEEIKQNEEMSKIGDVVLKVLADYGYTQTGYGLAKGVIELDLPKDEVRIKEIKAKITSSLKKKGLGDFEVNVRTFDRAKKEREQRWMPIFTTISDGLTAKAEYKVKGTGYTNRYDYFAIFITLSVSADDQEAKRLASAVEDTISDYLESESVKEKIKGDTYKIIIYSKEEIQLNQ
ncbi:MAG: DUF4030 domain-containing protein [Bacillota bacterium]